MPKSKDETNTEYDAQYLAQICLFWKRENTKTKCSWCIFVTGKKFSSGDVKNKQKSQKGKNDHQIN